VSKLTLSPQSLRWLLVLTSLLLITGMMTPMLTMTKFFVISHSVSVLSGIWQLYVEGQLFLFFVVAVFSVLLPIGKLALLFRILHPAIDNTPQQQRLLHLMHDYGRWAMLDVMVVAILIVTVKLGAIASIQIHYGLYVFGLAVLLIMFVTQQVVCHTQNTAD
jgi:paraquat-inducible protein A